MRWFKFLAVFAFVSLLLSVGPGLARADGPTGKILLTKAEMAAAVLVADGTVPAPDRLSGIDILPGQTVSSKKVYRLAGCDPKTAEKDTPCYFVVTAGRDFGTARLTGTIAPLSFNSTLSCGLNITNMFGVLLATLQENVNVTFWNSYGRTPATMNWGNLNGTRTWLISYTWSNLSGPNPNPGWGVRANNTAYAWASGILNWWPGLTQYYSIQMNINNNGWYCQ